MPTHPPGKQAQFGRVGTKRCHTLKSNDRTISRRVAPRHIGRMVETVIGCKWSLTVLELVVLGITRPGEMERSIEGLSAKVLNDCLRRLVEFNVLEKQSYPEVPPRVEYSLTEFGNKFRNVIDALDALESSFEVVNAGPPRFEHTAKPSRSRIKSVDDDNA